MMQLWDRKRGKPVYTTCIQPVTPYRRKRSHLKVRCVTKSDESYTLLIASVVSWVLFALAVVRWWNS